MPSADKVKSSNVLTNWIPTVVDAFRNHPAYLLIFALVAIFLVGTGLVRNQVDQFGWVGFAFFVATMGAAVLVIWRVEPRNQGAQDIQKIASAADEDLVAELLRKINDSEFRPDLIIGIARGGLIVAGYLSKQITKISTIPVISLWRQKGTNEFKNRFNRIELQREDFGRALSGPLKILIVDGVCLNGHTLDAAKKFVMASFSGQEVVVKTAAVYVRPNPRILIPDYNVRERTDHVYAYGEDE
jgi:hypoxanthine phosphoribosyltransferase